MNSSHRTHLRTALSTITAVAVLTAAAAVVVPAVVGVATPAAAAAGCTQQFGLVEREPRSAEYLFRRCGVPDFDQLRMALPGSPNGKMYCAPTAAIDWMSYIADRGSPQVMPGPGMAGNYPAIDQAITSMGAFMSTDPVNGTDGPDAVAAIRDWFDLSYGGRGGDFFTVWGYWWAGQETIDGVTHYHYPSARQLAGTAAMGWLIAPNIGWYKFQDGHMVRDGGHVVALASAEPDLWTHVGAYTLGFADPATDDGDANRQGVSTVDPVPARPTQISTDPTRIAHLDKLWSPGYSSGYLEGGYVITHKFGLLPDPAEPGRRMTLTRAVQLDEGPGDRLIETLDGNVIDIALGADGVSTTAVLEDGRLLSIENVDGTGTTVATIPGATDLAIDDAFRTAVIDSDGRITILDRHHNPEASVEIPGATGLAFSQRLSSFVTFDAEHQELVGIEAIPGNPVRLTRFAIQPDGPPITPTATLSVNPTTGIVGLLEPDTSQLTRAFIGDGQVGSVDTITLGDGSALEGLVADATGAWYSTRDGQLVAFDFDGNELADNPLAGRPSGPGFQIFQPMNLGTPPIGANVLPQDAPIAGDQLALDQASTTETVGFAHDVDVTLTDPIGTPLAGRPIVFTVAGSNSVTGTAMTDEIGHAVLSWSGTSPGDDVLTAWEDLNANGAHEPDEPAASLTVTWTESVATATSTALTSSANPSRRGQRVTFTATVTVQATGETPQGTVQFTSDGATIGAPVALDATGTARQSTKLLAAGVHRIDATFTPADGLDLAASSHHLDQFVGRYTWTGNLIRNAGADVGRGSITGDVVPIPAWTVDTGGLTAVRYGAVDPRTGLPFPTAASGPPNGGRNFFAGGPDNVGSLAVQIIPLRTNLLASIDAGTAMYRFAAWLGGFEDQNDLCEPVVLFTDAAGAPLDRGFLIGGQAADRNNETKLLPYETSARVPPGARTAHVALVISRTDGVYNDGYCDSLVLQIARPF